MGQIVKRKRKGRPSNIDRARRSSPVGPPSPVVRRRSRRRRSVKYHFNIDDYVDDNEFYDDEDEEEVGRREKKLRLLLFEDDSRSYRRVAHAPSSSSSSSSSEEENGEADVDEVKPLKRRKLDGDDDEEIEIEEIRGRKWEEEDDDHDDDEEEEEEEVDEEEEGEDEEAGGSDFVCGPASDLSKGVHMPDKKTLEVILDKLQKKDIYGVYAEPVDPEELPDYHDVIKHPMDFATVRKKLAKGLYLTLKEFESDVFLICANAMQYNAPDTIYYKQASSIQELAKLKFQRLRDNADRSEIELKLEHRTTPSFPLPKKQFKKPVEQTTQDPVGSETFSGATVRTGELPNGTSAQTPVRPNSGEVSIAENSSLVDNNLDKDQEVLPGKGFMSKLGRKPSVHDENRRATYNISVEPATDSDSVFSTFEGESKQFIPVGLHADHSYARSLARFAATLGSVAWKVASHTIEQALPQGVKFGRGWVGEYEPLPTPVLTPENRTLKDCKFFPHFKINSDVKDNKKPTQFTPPTNNRSPKTHADRKQVNDGFNLRVPVKQESHKQASKSPSPSPSPRPPFFSSFQANPVFTGSDLSHQNFTGPEKPGPPQVELNYPPAIHASAADFVARRPISNANDIPSPRSTIPISRNGNLANLASFKHPNSNNDGFPPGRPSKPPGLDCNRMVPTDNNTPSDRVQMVNMLAGRTQHQQNNNSNSFGKHPNSNDGFAPGRRSKPPGLDCNRMVPMDNNTLSNRVQMMNMLAEGTQHQQNNNSNGFGSKREDLNNAVSQVGSKREDSSNVALTAAQAWMSLGGAATAAGGRGFVTPPLAENTNPHKQQISADFLYNPTRDRHQPQVSRFRGEFNAYQQPVPVHAFVPQPLRPVNESQLQNRNVSFPQMVPTDLSRFQVQPGWKGVMVTPQMQQQQQQSQSRPKQQESRPPDLNIGYQSMGSPVRQSTGMLVDSQQPDLALQL